MTWGGVWQAGGVVWFSHGCKRRAASWMRDLPVDDQARLFLLCPATAMFRQKRLFLTTANQVVAGFHVLLRFVRGGAISA
jgi:hypothetical protein